MSELTETSAGTDALSLIRAELATVRGTVRRERADLWDLTLEASAGDDDRRRIALCYASFHLKLADIALTTVLETLRPILDGEEER